MPVAFVTMLVLASPPVVETAEIIALSPSAIGAAYNVTPLITSGYGGKNITVAVIDSSIDAQFYSDISGFNREFRFPELNISVVRPNGIYPTNASTGLDTFETRSDVELVHAMAPEARVLLVLVGHQSFLTGLSYVIDNNKADIVTLSGYEWRSGTTAMSWANDYNSELSRSVHENITLITGSGDFGSNNTVPLRSSYASSGELSPPPAESYDMPQYSPYVTVVGGTELTVNWPAPTTPVYGGERGWNQSSGGPSNLFPEPDWQTSNGVPKNGHRNIPDIALDASCRTPYVLFELGKIDSSCGTSLSAPVFAGMVADIEQAAGHRLGFLNPALYSLASSDPLAFHDITSGYSLLRVGSWVGSSIEPGYCATPGWDFVTGLGSPDAVRLLHYFAPEAQLANASVSASATLQSSASNVLPSCPSNRGYSSEFSLITIGFAALIAVPIVGVLYLRHRRSTGDGRQMAAL